MKVIYFLLFIFALQIPNSYCQHSGKDSLWKNFHDQNAHDTLRFQAAKDLIVKHKYINTKLDTTELLIDFIVKRATQTGLKKWQGEGYRLLGLAHYFNGNYDEAITFNKKCLAVKRELSIEKGQGSLLHNIAIAYRLLGNFSEALAYNFEALEVRKASKNEKAVALSLQSIATVYYNQDKLEAALDYALKAFELSEKLNYDIGMANAAVSMANVYADSKNFKKALENYNTALSFYEKLNRPSHQATCYDNIGNLYFKQKDYPKALNFQNKGLVLRKKIKNKKELALSYINLGSTFYELGDIKTNIDYCQKGLQFAEETKSQRLIYNACECLYRGYESRGDIARAFSYYKCFVETKDSIEGIEKTKLIEEIESKYELKEKEALLSKQALDIASEQHKRTNIIALALIILSLTISFFLWLRSRLQQRRQEAEQVAKDKHAQAEKLRELDKMKSTFFTNISHEFRTPLTLIISPLEQLLKGTLKGKTEKYQRIMHRNAKRLEHLINQLLELSKLESGHLRLNPKNGNLNQFLNSCAHSFDSLADRKQILYAINALDKSMSASFDQDILEKILTNLLSNAFKFTPEEGKIEVNFKQDGQRLIIEVEDSGIGIPADQIESIFDRFYSSNISSDFQTSSGIGLALTKELVELHGGTISVKSKVQQGTKFVVDLPLEDLEIGVKKSEPASPRRKAIEDEIAFKALNLNEKGQAGLPLVLIVEDNDDVRTYLYDQLKEKYRISEAVDGAMGLTIAQKELPDLIVSDVMMPGMDGNQMCKAIKSDPITSHIPIILLTARADQLDKIEGLETGADAYLTKPYDNAELLLRVKNLIDQRKQLREKFTSDFKFTPSEITRTSIDAQFLENLKTNIEKNLEEETFSVVELSKAMGMSRSNLFRKLKALTGQSPNQVIREMRLIRAKELLEKRIGNSAEVAYMVGFNSATYFTKCFSDFFGYPPTKLFERPVGKP